MAKDPHADRVVEAIKKVGHMMNVTFRDLSPPERCFVLHQVTWTYHASLDDVLEE